jgi:hypothetical protein
MFRLWQERFTIPLTAHSQERITMNIQTWFPNRISKTCSILIDGHVDQKGQTKKSAEGDDDSLQMNVFQKLMEGKHTMIVTKSDDDL